MGDQKYEVVLKAAETGSFKETARELGYTQAGISYLVSSLERDRACGAQEPRQRVGARGHVHQHGHPMGARYRADVS